MKENELELVKKSPYEVVRFETETEIYQIIEKVEYRDDYLKNDITCICKEDKYGEGSVELNITFSKVMEKHKIVFGYLEVPSRVANKGIGTQLMKKVFEDTRMIKKYLGINDEICLSGWLSKSDEQNGNWKNSIPFYEKIAKDQNVEVCFCIRGTNEKYEYATDFLENANSRDADVIYKIK